MPAAMQCNATVLYCINRQLVHQNSEKTSWGTLLEQEPPALLLRLVRPTGFSAS